MIKAGPQIWGGGGAEGPCRAWNWKGPVVGEGLPARSGGAVVLWPQAPPQVSSFLTSEKRGGGMSKYPCLVGRFQGMTAEEIKPAGTSLDDFDEALAGERWALREMALEGIIKRAEDGQVDAMEWLERHGAIVWPVNDVGI